MSMLRQDALTGRWVIIAADRSRRPNEFPAASRNVLEAGNCPFCTGHENETTPEILALGRDPGAAADSPGWRLRVFRNMYPALDPNAEAAPDGRPDAAEADLFPRAAGVGCHEVVAYTPEHGASPASLDRNRWQELLEVLQGRAREFSRHPAVRYVSPFCNHGPEAGATLAHPHMQIIGAPEVPLLAVRKAERLRAHHDATGECLVCRLAEAERRGGDRLIAANEHWTAFAPWASRFPWEMCFVPRRHEASLNGASTAELGALAEVLGPALKGLFAAHGDPSLNLVLHSAAVDTGGADLDPASYHWHLEVLPRLSRPAGFEVGTGYTINSVVPEDAAAWLRTHFSKS